MVGEQGLDASAERRKRRDFEQKETEETEARARQGRKSGNADCKLRIGDCKLGLSRAMRAYCSAMHAWREILLEFDCGLSH